MSYLHAHSALLDQVCGPVTFFTRHSTYRHVQRNSEVEKPAPLSAQRGVAAINRRANGPRPHHVAVAEFEGLGRIVATVKRCARGPSARRWPACARRGITRPG